MDVRFKQQLQDLLGRPRGAGMVVSCYVDMSRSGWHQTILAEAGLVRNQLTSLEAVREFDQILAEIRPILETTILRTVRGLAVFGGWKGAPLISVPSRIPFSDRVEVGEEAFIVPLIEVEYRHPGYLVVLVHPLGGRWWAFGPGGMQLLGQIGEEAEAGLPMDPVHARERNNLPVLGVLAGKICTDWDEFAHRGVVLLGDSHSVATLVDKLPIRLAAHVVHQTSVSWTAEPAEIEAQVDAFSRMEMKAQERYVLGELARRLREGPGIAAGPQAVLDRLRRGEALGLILGPDPGQIGSRCRLCRRIDAEPRKTCDECGMACQTCNVWQEILRLAVLGGVAIDLVCPDSELSRQGCAAALIDYNPSTFEPAVMRVAGAPAGR